MRYANTIASALAVLGFLAASRRLPAAEVAVVSAKSAVTTLTKSQVADIFLGRTTRFPDGSRAVPIDQAEGTPARDEFYTVTVGKTAAQMQAYWSRIIFTGRGQPPKAAPSGSDMKKFLVADPNAIGYLEAKLVDSTLRVVTVTP